MLQDCGGWRRHVVLTGGRGGRVSGMSRVKAGCWLQAPGKDLLVQLAHQEGGARHHLHPPQLRIV